MTISGALLAQGIVLWLAATPLAIKSAESQVGPDRLWAVAATCCFALGVLSAIAAAWVGALS